MLTFFLVIVIPAIVLYIDYKNPQKRNYAQGICTGMILACAFYQFLLWWDPKV